MQLTQLDGNAVEPTPIEIKGDEYRQLNDLQLAMVGGGNAQVVIA